MFFWRRRKTDKEEEEIIWEGKYFSEVKKNGEGKGEKYRVFFFNWNVAGLALPTCLGCPTPTPLNLWSMKITFRSSDTSTFFQSWGPVWDSNVFWNRFLPANIQGGLGLGAVKTLPKAQRTRGLSSSYQSNFFMSHHKFLPKSWSNFIRYIRQRINFKISTKHQHLD